MITRGGAAYSLRQVEKLSGLHRTTVAVLVRTGILAPAKESGFSHQDLVVLRTAKAMRDAGIAPRKVVNALVRLRRALPPDRHLASIRVRVRGDAIEVADEDGTLDIRSGQRLLALNETLSTQPTATPHPTQLAAAQELYERAYALEDADPGAAEAAYKLAIAADATLEAAYVNLGAMLCNSQRCKEALAVLDDALRQDLDTALVHFNRGIALEDLERPLLAVEAYLRALQLDTTLADAHYNLAALADRLGDAKTALRHFSAYRRLESAAQTQGE